MRRVKFLTKTKYGKLTPTGIILTFQKDTRFQCICECGTIIYSTKHNLESKQSTTCGECNWNLLNKKYNKLLVYKKLGSIKNDKQTYWECQCDCGSEKNVIVKTYHLLKGKVKSCGCVDTKFKKNPLLTDEQRLEKRSNQLSYKWSKQIKYRDKFICQVCLSYKKNEMVAHHIESYHCNPDLRLNLNNGICLCSECHILFHKKYGLKYNTRKQLEEFKENFHV